MNVQTLEFIAAELQQALDKRTDDELHSLVMDCKNARAGRLTPDGEKYSLVARDIAPAVQDLATWLIVERRDAQAALVAAEGE